MFIIIYMYKKLFIIALLASLPLTSFAAEARDLKGLINNLIDIVNAIIPLIFGIAIICFFWGVIKYIWAADPSKIKDARNYMVFSVIGIAVMLSVWGLALFLKNSFFPRANTPFNSTSQNVNSGAIKYCNGSYSQKQSCNHGEGPGTCDNFGQCIL